MEVTIRGEVYRTGILDARRQLHVARRLAPVVAAMAKSGQINATDKDSILVAVFSSAASILASMSDQDVDYVLNTCLGACQRRQGDQWASVMAAGGGLMFQDMRGDDMFKIAQTTIQENLRDFFFDPQATSEQAAPPA